MEIVTYFVYLAYVSLHSVLLRKIYFHNTKYLKLHPWIKILQKDPPNDDQVEDKEDHKGNEKPKAKMETETGIVLFIWFLDTIDHLQWK